MPETAETLHRLGYEAQSRGAFAEARRYYEQTLALEPDHAHAQLARAQLIMLQSGFREGRAEYEARFAARDGSEGLDWRAFPNARWRGEKLEHKRIYLAAEQGLGDAVLHASFLPHLLEQQPKRIVLGMFPKALPLFARAFPHIQVEALEHAYAHALSGAIPDLAALLAQIAPEEAATLQTDASGGFDYMGPLGDVMVHCLPGFVPARHQASHLIASPERVAQQRTRLAHLPGRKIGISWHANNPLTGSLRSIPLAQWEPILSAPRCSFISLQHHVTAGEIHQANPNIFIDETLDVVQDVEGLAALIACMDEVVTIDNSNAHLAGALGVKTMLMLPVACDFRWPVVEGETDTLWYRSVAVKRQQTARDWQPVITQVAAELRKKSMV